VVGKGRLEVDAGGLVEVPRRVVLLGAEDRTDFEDSLKAGADHQRLNSCGLWFMNASWPK